MARPKTFRDTWQRGRAIAGHFLPGLGHEKPLIVGSLVALFASVGLQLLEPWPLKFVIDAIADDSGARPLGDHTLAIAAAALVAIVALRATTDYFRSVGFALLGNRVTARIRARLYRHIQSLSLSFHDKARSGDLLVRVIGDIRMLRDVAVTALLPMLASVLMLAGMVAVMAVLNWRLTLLALGIVPLFGLSTVKFGRRIHAAARKQRQRESAMAATASEAIASVKVVQALSLESHFDGHFNVQNRRSLSDGVKTRRLAAKLKRSADVLVAVATAAVMWYGARLAMAGALSPGDLIVFLTYLKRGFRPLQEFAKYAGRLAKATAAGERIAELLEQTPEVQDAPDAVEAPRVTGAIEFAGVRFAYDAKHPVYDELSLRIAPRQHVVIAGESGAGKSTLLSLLLRLYQQQGGEVRVDGQDVRRWTLASLRSQISVVLQDTVLFAGNVYDNIAMGAPDVSAEAIEAAARLANAHEFISSLPQGYETALGERGVNLSKGQRQRIAIARAAVRDAPILLLDEPTVGLDEQNEQAVRAALRRLAAGRTTLLVSHDLRTAEDADLVVLIAGGRVDEQGSHAELLARGGRYAQLYRAQTGRLNHSPTEPSHVVA